VEEEFMPSPRALKGGAPMDVAYTSPLEHREELAMGRDILRLVPTRCGAAAMKLTSG